MNKIYRLFGIKILTIEELTPKEKEQQDLLKQHNPKGEVLEPDYEKEKDDKN
jgi:hypothetical protein